MAVAVLDRAIQHLAMLARLYVEALLVDEELADLEWEAWDSGPISDELAAWAWLVIAV